MTLQDIYKQVDSCSHFHNLETKKTVLFSDKRKGVYKALLKLCGMVGSSRGDKFQPVTIKQIQDQAGIVDRKTTERAVNWLADIGVISKKKINTVQVKGLDHTFKKGASFIVFGLDHAKITAWYPVNSRDDIANIEPLFELDNKPQYPDRTPEQWRQYYINKQIEAAIMEGE